MPERADPAQSERQSRADALNELLNLAFDALFWISEEPNRNESVSSDALALAERARETCALIEHDDPDKDTRP